MFKHSFLNTMVSIVLKSEVYLTRKMHLNFHDEGHFPFKHIKIKAFAPKPLTSCFYSPKEMSSKKLNFVKASQ